MTCKDCTHNEVCYMREVCNDIEEQIKELGCMDFIARSDAQEIKHGKWVKDDSDGCYCSVCEWYADYDYDYVTNNGLGNDDFNYCPHCGAKWTEVRNEVRKMRA